MNMKKDTISDIVVISLTIILATFCIVIYVFRFSGGLSYSQEIFGQFGDYVGGIVGTIISLLSLVYIYKTYKKQVDFSRHELEISRIQQFESSFFALLQNIQSLRHSFHVKTDRDFFDQVSEDLQTRMMEREYDLDSICYKNRFKEEDIAAACYEELYHLYGNRIGHYFRSIFHMINYVDKSGIPNKKKYIDLIQGQMSNSELYVLFYDGISKYGKKKLYPLLEQYGFLENLQYNDFEYFSRHQSLFYPRTSFKFNTDASANIVFIGGVHGVGKSTLIQTAISRSDITVMTASEIIKWNEISSAQNKKVNDIDDTQNKLIEGLRNKVDYSHNYILDGHFCLLDKDGEVQKVPFETFRAINPIGIVILLESSTKIVQRLNKRDGQSYSVELIHRFQEQESEYAKEVASILSIPFLEIHGQTDETISNFKSFIDNKLPVKTKESE